MQASFTPEQVKARLREIQNEHREWELANFGPQPTHRPLYGIFEEMGEFYRAILKHEQGIRGMESKEKLVAEVADSLADICIYTISLCSKLELDFVTAMEAIGYDDRFAFPVTAPFALDSGKREAEVADLVQFASWVGAAMPTKHHVDVELAKLTGYACFSLCARFTGRSLWDVLDEVWIRVVSKRDWKKNSNDGKVEELPLHVGVDLAKPGTKDTSKAVEVYSHPSCIFRYCPHPEQCRVFKGGCVNPTR